MNWPLRSQKYYQQVTLHVVHSLCCGTLDTICTVQSASGTTEELDCLVHREIYNTLYRGYGEAERPAT